MIIDSLTNDSLPALLSQSRGLAIAVNWLRQHGATAPEGRHDLDGDRIFALVQAYETIHGDAGRIVETHRRYVDVQHVAEGAELIDWWNTSQLELAQAYDEDRDLQLWSPAAAPLPVVLRDKLFAVFFPADAHRPKGAADTAGTIRKVVVKVDLSLI